MPNVRDFDDPIWEYVLATKLTPYLEDIRKFWAGITSIPIIGTGVYPVKDAHPGLFYRVTNTPVRSPIKHVQVFPFIPTAYLQITGVSGGSVRMVSNVCGKGFKLEEFTVIEKSNLPSTYHQGQFVAFVPTDILEGLTDMGKWVYLTAAEMAAIAHGSISNSIKSKMLKNI